MYCNPRDPTNAEIAEQNYKIDLHIKDLEDYRQAQYDRINDPKYLLTIKNGYETELNRLYNMMEFFKTHKGDSKLIDCYQKQFDDLLSYYEDTDNLLSFQDRELAIWDDYSNRIDEQINTLNDMRWK
jgi:hypothetical protein